MEAWWHGRMVKEYKSFRMERSEMRNPDMAESIEKATPLGADELRHAKIQNLNPFCKMPALHTL